ncbi:MAG: hypothetical protein U1A78_14635 [Polyangia bacterium]
MSQADAELVASFLGARVHEPVDDPRDERDHDWSARWLHDAIEYDLFVADERPISTRLQGRRLVQAYLDTLRDSYQIIEPGPTVCVPRGDVVIARGSELASLLFRAQTVRAEWVASCRVERASIRRISMCVFRFTIVTSQRRSA